MHSLGLWDLRTQMPPEAVAAAKPVGAREEAPQLPWAHGSPGPWREPAGPAHGWTAAIAKTSSQRSKSADFSACVRVLRSSAFHRIQLIKPKIIQKNLLTWCHFECIVLGHLIWFIPTSFLKVSRQKTCKFPGKFYFFFFFSVMSSTLKSVGEASMDYAESCIWTLISHLFLCKTGQRCFWAFKA